MKFTRLDFPDLVALEFTGTKGEEFDVDTANLDMSQIANYRVFLEGEFGISTDTGNQQPAVRKAGDTSDTEIAASLGDWGSTATFGKLTTKVLTDTAVHWCLRDRNNKKINFRSIKPAIGDEISLVKGESLIVVKGAVGGKSAPAHFLVSSDTAKLTADADSWVLIYKV